MGWPYEFVDLSPEQRDQRRRSIDLFACIAHYSALAPAVLYLLVRLARRLTQRLAHTAAIASSSAYEEVPRSPLAKANRHATSNSLTARWQRLQWWLYDDVCVAGLCWGQRDEWVLGLAWAAWLLLLCFLGTGRDYLHLTKRFGAIAVSQLPIQYLVALKAFNPFAWAFGSSHESLNRYHRVLGRIIYHLVVIHALLYNYFLLASGIWLKRFFAPMVFCGVVAYLVINTLAITSIARVRALSYRLFFISHVLSALIIPPLIFFHAPSTRLYLGETLIIFALNLGVRKATSIISPATIEAVPGTSLVKLSLTLPPRKLALFADAPGSHVYLSIPSGSRPGGKGALSCLLFDFLYNPFTVAHVDQAQNSLTLVARLRHGPMSTALSGYASSSNSAPDHGQIPLAIDGPYGAMTHLLDELFNWGAARVLLFAGGVGATFVWPVYRALQAESPSVKAQLIWAVRGAADVAAAVSSVIDNQHVEIFVTGETDARHNLGNSAGGAIEMTSMPLGGNDSIVYKRHHRRPDIAAIINDAFRQGTEERIAILVCGPVEMTQSLRQSIRPWAMRGRQVWWHSESFGW